MQPALRTALRTVATALHAEAVTFVLGGSGLLCALGLTDDVGDLDLMVAADDRDRVATATATWSQRLAEGDAPALWCSPWLAVLDVEEVTVEVIGGLCVRAHGRAVPLPLRASGAWDVDGCAVPLADPAAWWWLYQAYKPAKALLLETVVSPSQRAAIVAELGPPATPQ